jgi:Mg2+-importing ATPase
MSVEDLGNMDTLCIDKTGTLTEGKFTFSQALNLEGKEDREILRQALLCTTGFGGSKKIALTNATDQALWESPQIKPLVDSLKNIEVLEENAFDYTRQRMGMLVCEQGKTALFVKGAFESILPICLFLKAEAKEKAKIQVQSLEEQGFRVIAVCKKEMPLSTKMSIQDEKDMILLGFLLFEDPVKSGVKQALQLFSDLGVQVKILSGDSLVVTKAVAIQAGLDFQKEEIIDGQMLAMLSKEAFDERILTCCIFARITPQQKFQIVSSLNREGHVVGFLGDGVNDAPAIRAADVGIAVNTGADVSKETADIILLQKDLEVLALGIMQGRKTFGNIMKYILNTMSANYGNMFTVAISSLFLKFIPLLPSQILLNNFLSDIPLLAVASDRVDKEFVQKPKQWNFKMIRSFMIHFGLISTCFDLLLIVPLLAWRVTPEVFRTAWFVESSLSEIIVTFAIRTKLPFYKSMPSYLLLGLSLIISGLVILLPTMVFGQKFFAFTQISWNLWVYIGVIVGCYFIVVEKVKQRFFRKWE